MFVTDFEMWFGNFGYCFFNSRSRWNRCSAIESNISIWSMGTYHTFLCLEFRKILFVVVYFFHRVFPDVINKHQKCDSLNKKSHFASKVTPFRWMANRKILTSSPKFNPLTLLEWLTSNFSLQYHSWIRR